MADISLCMIIKDEEKWLENCLNSIKDLVEEIIIVDTGSEDKSKEIAKKFTDKVYDFKWNDNFSDARNFAISKATKSWILSFDADEIIADFDKEKIKRIIELDEADSYFFNWRNYTNDAGVAGFTSSTGDRYEESKGVNGFCISKVLRFFKNKPAFKFEGKIHETVENSIKTSGGTIFDTDVVMHHFGNLDKKKFLAKKSQYIELLRQRLKDRDFKEKPEDYVCSELAGELINSGNSKEGLYFLEKAVSIKEEYIYLYNLGTQYLVKGRLDDAEKALKKAIILSAQHLEPYNPNNPQKFNCFNPSIYNNLGAIYSEKGEINKAIKTFKRAIELNPKFADAYFNLGLNYRKKGKMNKSERFFEEAIELNPAYEKRINQL